MATTKLAGLKEKLRAAKELAPGPDPAIIFETFRGPWQGPLLEPGGVPFVLSTEPRPSAFPLSHPPGV